MQVNNDNKIFRNDRINEVRTEDILAAAIGEDGREDRIGAIADKKAKRKQEASLKPKSVAMLNNELDTTGIIDQFAEKMATSAMGTHQTELKKQVKADIEKTVKEYYSKESQKPQRDAVVLSKAAVTYGDDSIKKPTKKSDTDRTESKVGLFETEEGNESGTLTRTGIEKKSGVQRDMSQTVSERRAQEDLTDKRQQQIESLMKKMANAYAETVIKEGSDKAQVVEDIRNQLLGLGVSTKRLKTLENSVQQYIYTDIKKQTKASFLSYALAFAPKQLTLELLKNRSHYEDVINLGKKLGFFSDGDDSELEDIKDDARSDLRSFVSQELDEIIISGKINQQSTQAIIKAFDQFNSIAGVARFSAEGYLKQFHSKLDNWGLGLFKNETPKGVIDTESRGNQSDRGSHERETLSEEETVLLEDQIRQLYIQIAVSPGIFNGITTRLQLIKFKKMMTDQGYQNANFERLKKEALGLAKMRLMLLLRQALEERAALSELKGPPYQLVKQKIRIALRGLKRIGQPITRAEFKVLRDQVNKAIFSIIKEEFIKTAVLVQANQHNRDLAEKYKNLLNNLERLKAESKITEEIQPKMFSDKPMSSDTKIIEAA